MYKPIAVVMSMFFVLAAHAQKQACTLTGTIKVKDGPSYPYRVELEVGATSAKGITVTDQDGTLVRMKANASIKKDMNLLMLTENAAMGMIPDSMEMCYVNAVLKWKVRKNTVRLQGAFVGKNKSNAICYQGSLELEAPAASCPFIDKPIEKKQPEAAVTDTVAADGGHKITDGIDKRLTWTAPVCTLEIWDGGVIDGDVITVLHNGKELLANHSLSAERKQLVVTLAQGVNTFTFVAGDEGSAPPNTAQIVLHDGDTQHRLTAFNKKGRTAKIILIK